MKQMPRFVCVEGEVVPDEFQLWLADAIKNATTRGLQPDAYVWDVSSAGTWRKLWEQGYGPAAAVSLEFEGGNRSIDLEKLYAPHGSGRSAFRRGISFATESMPHGFAFCPHDRGDSEFGEMDYNFWVADYAREFFSEAPCAA